MTRQLSESWIKGVFGEQFQQVSHHVTCVRWEGGHVVDHLPFHRTRRHMMEPLPVAFKVSCSSRHIGFESALGLRIHLNNVLVCVICLDLFPYLLSLTICRSKLHNLWKCVITKTTLLTKSKITLSLSRDIVLKRKHIKQAIVINYLRLCAYLQQITTFNFEIYLNQSRTTSLSLDNQTKYCNK